jgi:AcrR family transcriptional regulator
VLDDSRAELRAKVVDHAAALLRDHGPSAVTTRRVAEAAGIQAPTIYRLFGDKDGLLDAVAEHVMTSWVTAKAADAEAAESAGVDALADLRAGWSAQIAFGLANPALMTLLSDPTRRSPAARAGGAVLAARVHRLAAEGRLRVSERRAVDLIRAAGTGAVLTILGQEEPDPALADALFDAVCRSILADTALPDASPRAVAVAFQTLVPSLTPLTDGERALLDEWLQRVVG